jgi:hypothetical protein
MKRNQVYILVHRLEYDKDKSPEVFSHKLKGSLILVNIPALFPFHWLQLK